MTAINTAFTFFAPKIILNAQVLIAFMRLFSLFSKLLFFKYQRTNPNKRFNTIYWLFLCFWANKTKHLSKNVIFVFVILSSPTSTWFQLLPWDDIEKWKLPNFIFLSLCYSTQCSWCIFKAICPITKLF